MRRLTNPLIVLGILLATACVTVIRSGSIDMIAPVDVRESRAIESPMKAFLLDGSMVVYQLGAEITTDSIIGPGMRHSLGLTDSMAVRAVSLDSLAGIEAFQGGTLVAASIVATLGFTALATVGTAAMAVAIFGSCPTFYASAEQGGVLQSEAFSYSIAPLLESRDLDALHVAPDADGIIRLELRNEALETHYINHLELLAVDHAPDALVIPDERGSPVALRSEAAPLAAIDREGRDVLNSLDISDDAAFASSTRRITSATGSDPNDYVELTFPRPEGQEGVLRLRLRNSLLNTVLFYDMMLGSAGAGAVDWIGQDMARIGSVVELGRWFQDAMGLRVDVHDGMGWVPAGRITDTGPIAWEEVGVRVPLGESNEVRVRLTFLTDAWRIDQASLGQSTEIARSHRVPIARMSSRGAPVDPDVLERLASPDEEYLTTHPASSAALEFDPPLRIGDLGRSYLLASQGYYTEWIRPNWIREAKQPATFQPDDRTLETLMDLWLEKRDAFQSEFYDSRIPVR